MNLPDSTARKLQVQDRCSWYQTKVESTLSQVAIKDTGCASTEESRKVTVNIFDHPV